MKVFIAYGYVSGENLYDVVVANTKEEALGLCLEYHKYSKAENWGLDEVSLTHPHVSEVTSWEI
jgi:hypothetical protein